MHNYKATFTFGLETDRFVSTCLLAIGSFLLAVFLLLRKKDTLNRPPACKGWIPWLGCAIEFGKSPLSFIEEKRKELGPVYTLHVAGEKLTFITEPDDFHYFFRSKNVDFQQAVKEVVGKVANIEQDDFFKYHTNAHDTVKWKLSPAKLETIIDDLCMQFNTFIDDYFDAIEEHNLMEKVKRSMYASIINNLFGEDTFPVSNKEKFEEFLTNFKVFDEQFEMGAKLPEILLPQWSSAKSYLIGIFRSAIARMDKTKINKENMTVLEAFVEKIQGDSVSNYSMTIMWASLANAIPMTFWALTHILSNEQIKSRIMEDLKRVFGDRKTETQIQVTEADLRQMPYLRWCVLEAIRLRSVGVITRRVIKPFTIRGYDIEPGSMLMVSPHWASRNEKLFPDPDSFIPDRWSDCISEQSTFMEGFIAFGGGRYQCPGRWFAQLEIQMYIVLFLLKFDTTIHSDIPKSSMKHMVGTQHPETPFLVTCTRQQTKNQ